MGETISNRLADTGVIAWDVGRYNSAMPAASLDVVINESKQSWFDSAKNLAIAAAEWYFKPKSFEKSGKIYERLGVRKLKKGVTNIGKFAYTAVGNIVCRKLDKKERKKTIEEAFKATKRPNNYWLWDKSSKGLKSYEKYTRFNEVFHVFGGAFTVANGLYFHSHGNEAMVIFASSAVIAQAYLVMTQRYNRNRLLNVQERMNARSGGAI